MWSVVVVVFEMLVQVGLHFFSRRKDVEVEDLVSEFAIEAFYISILSRFAWLNESSRYAVWKV